MKDIGLSKSLKIWSIYIMAAPAMKGLTYFKIGITSDIAKRVCAVQTGCPLRITRAWAITVWGSGAAQSVESAMHKKMAPFHSHGEWFAMQTDCMEHKKAINQAMAFGHELATGGTGKQWNEVSIPDLKLAVRELAKEQLQHRQRQSKKRVSKAMIQMITSGRRIL